MSRANDLVERIDGVSVSSINADSSAESFLRERQSSLAESIRDDEIVSLGDVFYTGLASRLAGIGIESAFETAVEDLLDSLSTGSGGYKEITKPMIEQVHKWDADETAAPTALGTSYSVLLVHLLDLNYPRPPTESQRWLSGIQSDGLFINEDWSETNLDDRYPSEYLAEAFLSHVAGQLLEDVSGASSPDIDETASVVNSRPLFSVRHPSSQFSAEYYSIRILEMAGAADFSIDDLSDFLENHRQEVGFGYQEYLLSEKSDRQSGSSSRTGRDSVNPHINATVQSLLLQRRYDLRSDAELSTILSSTLTEATRDNGGYGFPIQIREYDPDYGPTATSRTTYYALLGRGIF